MCAGLGVFVTFDHFILESASICKCVYPAGTGDRGNSSCRGVSACRRASEGRPGQKRTASCTVSLFYSFLPSL